MAAGGESADNNNKPVFPGFCHFASLPSRQILLMDLTVNPGCDDSQAVPGSAQPSLWGRGTFGDGSGGKSRPLRLAFGHSILSRRRTAG